MKSLVFNLALTLLMFGLLFVMGKSKDNPNELLSLIGMFLLVIQWDVSDLKKDVRGLLSRIDTIEKV